MKAYLAQAEAKLAHRALRLPWLPVLLALTAVSLALLLRGSVSLLVLLVTLERLVLRVAASLCLRHLQAAVLVMVQRPFKYH